MVGMSQGRMKFTRPLYRELYALGGDTRATAVNTFKERASFYHPICRTMVAKDLQVDLGKQRGGGETGDRVGGAARYVRRCTMDVFFAGRILPLPVFDEFKYNSGGKQLFAVIFYFPNSLGL